MLSEITCGGLSDVREHSGVILQQFKREFLLILHLTSVRSPYWTRIFFYVHIWTPLHASDRNIDTKVLK